MQTEDRQYLTFTITNDPKLSSIERWGERVGKSYRVNLGLSMADFFPPEVELQLSDDSGDMVVDFVPNIMRSLFVSDGAKGVFEDAGVVTPDVEYLPFKLLDKGGRHVPKSYFFVNPLLHVECLDWERSKLQKYDGSDELQKISAMRVLPEAIPEDVKLFRLAEQPFRILIRSDLLETLLGQGFTGIFTVPMGEELPV